MKASKLTAGTKIRVMRVPIYRHDHDVPSYKESTKTILRVVQDSKGIPITVQWQGSTYKVAGLQKPLNKNMRVQIDKKGNVTGFWSDKAKYEVVANNTLWYEVVGTLLEHGHLALAAGISHLTPQQRLKRKQYRKAHLSSIRLKEKIRRRKRKSRGGRPLNTKISKGMKKIAKQRRS